MVAGAPDVLYLSKKMCWDSEKTPKNFLSKLKMSIYGK